MKAENVVAIILIAGAGTMVAYFVISNWWSQTHQTIPHGIYCETELKEFQSNLELSKRQQTEAIIMANQTLKKLIDDSIYCEFMGFSTGYNGYGPSQVLNINLNDTKELTVEVNPQNNSVVSYELTRLTRSGGPVVYVEPVNIVLPYIFFGAMTSGIIVYFFKIKKKK
ncbi:MAG: hypothetical protein KGH83_02590 [Thaumarchaeota archaeon]|nr:hypothetical protein [Nitrososphaerota archaeon]